MRAGGSPMPTPKGTPSQTDHSTKANFMTPTMASAKKASHNQTSTPTSTGIEKAVTGKWMTSAVRRVGLRRVRGDDIPRSKKEGSKQPHNAISFPDKLSASSRGQMLDAPSPKVPASLLSDKPLPSPPIAQIKNDHIEEPRSLIDASEKPLHRTSPKSPQEKEEWPVLFPQKPTTPKSLRKMLHQPSHEPARATSGSQERYPLLRGPEATTSDLKKPTSKVPSTHRIERKDASASYLQEKFVRPSPAEGHGQDSATNQTLNKRETPQAEPKVAHRLSAGAAAVEKASSEAKSIKEPRQTRTSSLRARISAGQVIKDSPNKVLGFTDFTVEKGPLAKVSNEDLGSSAGFRARPSSSFSKAFTKKSSRESLGGSRAPAQFVAGSRRPAARRLSSRNSLHNDARAASPAFLEHSRPAAPVPTAKTDPSTRKSSIPISRNTLTAATGKAESGAIPNNAPISTGVVETETGGNNGLATYEDGSKAASEECDFNGRAVDHSDQYPVLESIEESPKSTFRSKRLSATPSALGHGPTLKISSSANRIIMGTGESNQENQPLAKKKSKDLFRAAITNEHRNVTKGKTTSFSQSKTSTRPLSSQGFPENRSHSDLPGNAHKVKKIKSADMSVFFSSAEQKLEPNAHKAEGANKRIDTSAVEDPFSNAIGERHRESKGVLEAESAGHGAADGTSVAPVISPVKNSATPSSDAIPVVPAFLPETVQEHVNKSNGISESTRVDEVKARKADNGPHTINTHLQLAPNQNAPSTPQTGVQKQESPSSDSFPPRSSSRMKHPDYTISGSSKSSSVLPIDRVAVQLQKEISAAEPVEAAITDSGNSRQLSNTDSEASRHEISSQTILADVGRKRDSIARESNKSQASVTKGLISNFRGLFHKRASDGTEAYVARSTKEGGKRPTVTAHGSPFPSMSNIHPIHRPTQASINRSSAASQRPSSHGLVVNSSGSPVASPVSSDVSTTTTLAMQILDSVRRESSSPKKERLLEMGKLMVDTITQARDAEKAMEEAKQAARKAEVAHALCKKSVSDVANLVREWKGEVHRL
ncbi:MAG: hypothetical protein LQ343_007648 [Gyalolechia ehrenbergii]|nr:MAG: hypothetical protein LQ343_007648 [Gyalolechia ehrenbergii]